MDQTLEATLIVEDRGVDGGRLGIYHTILRFLGSTLQQRIEMISPTAGSRVTRFTTVTARVYLQDGSWPVVAVRPLQTPEGDTFPGENYSIQPPVTEMADDGTFSSAV